MAAVGAAAMVAVKEAAMVEAGVAVMAADWVEVEEAVVNWEADLEEVVSSGAVVVRVADLVAVKEVD
jgi:hypothetical protein